MEVKSVITRPSPGVPLKGPGYYEIQGSPGRATASIRQVEVSADGGQSWAAAALQEPDLTQSAMRFRAPWRWNGDPAVLQSRATDDTGMVQPTRAQFMAERGLRGGYHYNAIASWRIDEKGETINVYAERLILCAAMLIAVATPATSQDPQFGQPITPVDIARWDISIGTDGPACPRAEERLRKAKPSMPRSGRLPRRKAAGAPMNNWSEGSVSSLPTRYR